MGGLAVNEEESPMGVCAETRARSVRISVAMVFTVALAWAFLGVTGAGIAHARSFSDVDSSVSYHLQILSLIHISEPTRRTPISYAVFCLKKKKIKTHKPST